MQKNRAGDTCCLSTGTVCWTSTASPRLSLAPRTEQVLSKYLLNEFMVEEDEENSLIGEQFQTVRVQALGLWLGEVDEHSGSLAPSNYRGRCSSTVTPSGAWERAQLCSHGGVAARSGERRNHKGVDEKWVKTPPSSLFLTLSTSDTVLDTSQMWSVVLTLVSLQWG